jgi:sugar phosphate isomerase/epimerase
MSRFFPAPFLLGATSYIRPGDLAENAQWLSDETDVMQLVLFQTPQAGNMPDGRMLARLQNINEESGLRYLVHLPHDLGPDNDHMLARRIIDQTSRLHPEGWIVHLDGLPLLAGRPQAMWLADMEAILRDLLALAPDPADICLENLENYEPEAFFPLLERLPLSVCVDIGHLRLMGREPWPYLSAWLPRTRVIHWHAARNGSAHLPVTEPQELREFWSYLLKAGFKGVCVLEVFEQDYNVFVEALRQVLGVREWQMSI